jgi:hypothetical protein
MEADLFDDLLGLEERFYDEGFQLGKADGAKAGRIEGRVFGLEKGFEKYVESGRLHGRSLVWASQLPNSQVSNGELLRSVPHSKTKKPTSSIDDGESSRASLPRLPKNPRLEKHLRVLYALTEPISLSTENTEDAVSDFDDRLKRAKAKVKVVERLIGENDLWQNASQGANNSLSSQQTSSGGTDGNIEDVSALKARH